MFSLAEEGVPMIECSAREKCPFQRWYHMTCLDVTAENTDLSADWWCDEDCEVYSIFCVCQKHKPGAQLIQCASGDYCLAGERFHLECVGRSKVPGNYLTLSEKVAVRR